MTMDQLMGFVPDLRLAADEMVKTSVNRARERESLDASGQGERSGMSPVFPLSRKRERGHTISVLKALRRLAPSAQPARPPAASR